MTGSRLQVYLVEKRLDSYIEAIEAIENSPPLKGILTFNLHIKGTATTADKPNSVLLRRKLGSRPAIQVISHGFYSTVRLSNNGIVSLVGILDLGPELEDRMICFLSDCDIIAVDVDADIDDDIFKEEIPVQAKLAFPWVYIRDVLQA